MLDALLILASLLLLFGFAFSGCISIERLFFFFPFLYVSLWSDILLATRSLHLVLTLPTLVVYLAIEHYSALFDAYMVHLHSHISKYYIKTHLWV